MKTLCLGASGQVGFELCQSMAPVAKVVAPGFGGLPRIDLADAAALEKCVADVKPDIIVNAAAYTAVDKAESERDLATAVNAEAPGVLSRAAAKLGAVMVHYSTDYVFDGSGTSPRSEDDATGPLNHYGASKLAGEQAVLAENPHSLVFRTSWVYAAHGKNFPKTILKLAAARDSLNVVADQVGAPTGARLIADATVQALLQMSHKPQAYGLYHLVAGGEVSWHGLADFLCDGAVGLGLLPRKPAILPIASKDYPTPAPRPLNSRLNTTKFRQTFGLRLPDWKSGASHLLRELAQSRL